LPKVVLARSPLQSNNETITALSGIAVHAWNPRQPLEERSLIALVIILDARFKVGEGQKRRVSGHINLFHGFSEL
jgi:hypothetical protein